VRKRDGNNPKRRIAALDAFPPEFFEWLATAAHYGGSANHKLRPGNYGFHPAQNPRPSKSLCDRARTILQQEAATMLARGISSQMVSSFCKGGFPKYVWAVDADGEAYEAKIGEDGASYHGYRLGEDERAFRKRVIDEWKLRHRT